MHGREIINGAIEREWPQNLSVDSMVRMRAWYLERTGNDVEDMVFDTNWNELLKITELCWTYLGWMEIFT